MLFFSQGSHPAATKPDLPLTKQIDELLERKLRIKELEREIIDLSDQLLYTLEQTLPPSVYLPAHGEETLHVKVDDHIIVVMPVLSDNFRDERRQFHIAPVVQCDSGQTPTVGSGYFDGSGSTDSSAPF